MYAESKNLYRLARYHEALESYDQLLKFPAGNAADELWYGRGKGPY